MEGIQFKIDGISYIEKSRQCARYGHADIEKHLRAYVASSSIIELLRIRKG